MWHISGLNLLMSAIWRKGGYATSFDNLVALPPVAVTVVAFVVFAVFLIVVFWLYFEKQLLYFQKMLCWIFDFLFFECTEKRPSNFKVRFRMELRDMLADKSNNYSDIKSLCVKTLNGSVIYALSSIVYLNLFQAKEHKKKQNWSVNRKLYYKEKWLTYHT